MNKSGKYLGSLVVVLAICVAVTSFFVLTQAKKFRYRSQILAKSLADTAQRLDSGSGRAGNVTFTAAAEENKESGTLGWPECAKEGVDLSAAGNSYAGTAEEVVKLAEDVIHQRDGIIDKIDSIAAKLNPGNRAPKVDELKDLTKYETGLTDFQNFVNALVARDNNLRNMLNTSAAMLAIRQRYTGEITANGSLSAADNKFFAEIGAKVKTADKNFRTYQELARTVARTLHGSKVNGVRWTAVAPSDNKAYGAGVFGTPDARVVATITADMKTLNTQLKRIDQLEGQLSNAREEIASHKKSISALQERIQEQEKIIKGYFRQGLGIAIGDDEAEIKSSEDAVAKDIAGEVIAVDNNFGYVVLNLSNRDIVKDMLFTVHRNGAFVAAVKVTRVEDYNSIATVIIGKQEDVQIGDAVLRAPEIVKQLNK